MRDQSFTSGFSAKMEPPAIEVFIARQIRRLAIPVKERHVQNPIPLSPDLMRLFNPRTKKDWEKETAFDRFLQAEETAAARTDSGHHHSFIDRDIKK